MRQVGSVLWPKLRVLQIYGANTGVGKTIFSSILCRAFLNKVSKQGGVRYLKPVSTGPLDEADDSKLVWNANHDQPIDDRSIVTAVHDELRSYASNEEGIAIVETAGGVLSPAPSGTSQADLYRPLRLPIFLVGDHQLGGIGTTISAWESLILRGYNVQQVALFSEDRYDNHSYLADYFGERGVPTFSIPPPPDRHADAAKDTEAMRQYYEQTSSLSDVAKFTHDFFTGHEDRIDILRSMPAEADKVIWHPFMQHRERSKDTIVAMDSAYGDYFQTYTTKQDPATTNQASEPILKPAFDGSASWWTQGLGHGNPRLALVAAHAAGRYGHVMFAGAVHEPALQLAQTLIAEMGNPRLAKLFYTDNGSTGMEVAVKMALRATALRKRWSADDDVKILGLKGSYHGDTIGTMDCSEPSIFNKKVEWYSGRGHWLDFPTVKMRQGQWTVDMPHEFKVALGGTRTLDSLRDVFDAEKRSEDLALYTDYCKKTLEKLSADGQKFGALIMEPILLGAGGMFFADPLFQRALVDAVRGSEQRGENTLDWSGMPVVFDEVFAGLYRLGRFSAATFLNVDPDIVVNAKLLTGGLLPLCTTTASQAIFDAFLSDDKSDALLHGHSYTAHAVGCAVANESLSTMMKMDGTGAWDEFQADWRDSRGIATREQAAWSMWSSGFVTEISHRPNVDHVFALGSVLAISLKDPAGASYASTAATGLRDQMLADDGEWIIHSRVLGNVLYLMAALTTSAETLSGVEAKVLAAL
nr:bifunctional dethiobiotin synthetase/7,8-diamino-pelargonic acid aminotransferase, mitochondrial [Quercus suber]